MSTERPTMTHPSEAEPDVARLNALSDEEARERLAACLAVPRWIDEVATGRPYAAWRDAEARATAAAAELDDDELAAALAGHPRIGERASGPRHQAEHSAREQAGVDPSDARVARA